MQVNRNSCDCAQDDYKSLLPELQTFSNYRMTTYVRAANLQAVGLPTYNSYDLRFFAF